jgi:hypothetical protein
MEEIERLREGWDVGGMSISKEEIPRAIERIGQRLYRDLFPPELRREYRQFREKVRTLYIVSDEPWIPWELVKPYESDAPSFEDDFLCMQFDLARWVMPDVAPAAEIAMRSLACVAPRDSKLKAAQEESEYVRSLAQRMGVRDLTPAHATREEILKLLEGEEPISLWHFACHGEYHDNDPDQSPLKLSNNTSLRPNDLVGPKVEKRLKGDRPFVFLNACRVGSLGLSLAGLGGWAKVLVSDCHVGGLIAPLWAVTDRLAHNFAQAFYEHAQSGCTLAQAMRRARQATRNADSADPTWLAYSLYAHPNARLNWATKAKFDGGLR